MQDKLISIIVPVYNVKNYLEECVNSLMNQTYKELEIILVDDGSTDNSGEICDVVAQTDSRIRVIHKENGGLSDARNIGIMAAKGEFIGFVDSDDWIEPTMYAELYEACNNNDADISICSYYRDYIDKCVVGNRCKSGVYKRDEAIGLLLEGIEIQDHAVTKLYRRELWRDVQFPVKKIYEDIRTIYKVILKSSTICVMEKPLYHYRQRSGSIVRNGFSVKRLELAVAVKELYDDSVIAANPEWLKLLEVRELRVKAHILRELLIYGDKNSWRKYKNIENEYISLIKKNRRLLLSNKAFSKVFKLMAIISFTNSNFFETVFSMKLVKRYFKAEYRYFE